MKTHRSALAGLLCLAGLAAGAVYTIAASADEQPPAFTAAQLLTPSQLKGPHTRSRTP